MCENGSTDRHTSVRSTTVLVHNLQLLTRPRPGKIHDGATKSTVKCGSHFVKVPSDHVYIAGQRLQEVIGLIGAKVPCAQDVLYPAWDLRKHAQHTTLACL